MQIDKVYEEKSVHDTIIPLQEDLQIAGCKHHTP
jgi:hypothetical protein